jgi:hypothetical protein
VALRVKRQWVNYTGRVGNCYLSWRVGSIFAFFKLSGAFPAVKLASYGSVR